MSVMRRIGARARARRIAVVSAAVALVGVGLGLDGAWPRGQPAPRGALPTVVSAVEAARRGAMVPDGLQPAFATIKLFPRKYRIRPDCYSHNAAATRVASRVCRAGSVSSKRTVVLLGDSHAFMWLPAVLELGRRDGWAVVPLIRFGCTPGRWFTNLGPEGCRTWLRWATAQIQRLDPEVILLGGSIDDGPTPWTAAATEGTIEAARRLKPLGRVVVIGDPEALAADPVPCLTARRATLSGCMTTWASASLEAYDAVARAAGKLGVGFIRTRGFVCYQRQCPAVVGRTIVWMDNNHLTGLYSAQLASAFRSAFRLSVPTKR